MRMPPVLRPFDLFPLTQVPHFFRAVPGGDFCTFLQDSCQIPLPFSLDGAFASFSFHTCRGFRTSLSVGLVSNFLLLLYPLLFLFIPVKLFENILHLWYTLFCRDEERGEGCGVVEARTRALTGALGRSCWTRS